MQFQPEPGEPAAQLVPEPLGVLPVLEPADEVVLDDPCGQPLADQLQDPFIRDPVPDKLSQPVPVKLAEEVGLVVNAVALWNTRYLSGAVDQLRAEGVPVKDEDVARLSPLGHAHINFPGPLRHHRLRTRPGPSAVRRSPRPARYRRLSRRPAVPRGSSTRA